MLCFNDMHALVHLSTCGKIVILSGTLRKRKLKPSFVFLEQWGTLVRPIATAWWPQCRNQHTWKIRHWRQWQRCCHFFESAQIWIAVCREFCSFCVRSVIGPSRGFFFQTKFFLLFFTDGCCLRWQLAASPCLKWITAILVKLFWQGSSLDSMKFEIHIPRNLFLAVFLVITNVTTIADVGCWSQADPLKVLILLSDHLVVDAKWLLCGLVWIHGLNVGKSTPSFRLLHHPFSSSLASITAIFVKFFYGGQAWFQWNPNSTAHWTCLL